ncbi:ribulose-phosphate 3-epimerase [Pectinatus haikarae]|uniref:Ribulose-phosphate 3-epimerase n=1 Tax=Pectinatus haikarae TaxID=349096 RepID=A0ABT9YB88_9FIRM|nr:ribulose-phosphate 3-epimerase [Pectinatus haikarae]MDQ0205088.1 ribulose-phosphate 3-epimerase [Pectinatus haikarae]
MKKLLCPSMMCAKYENFLDEIKLLDEAGVDILHNDVMDGRFVPNFGMGMQDMEVICKNAKTITDIHLMVEEPERYIDKFAKLGVSIIYIHPESSRQAVRTLQNMRYMGVHPGIAVSPEVTVDMLIPYFSLVDYIMVMTVNPGFSGQKYLPFIDDKIVNLIAAKKQNKYNYKIMIDGACSPDIIKKLSSVGVDGFILGSTALFNKGRNYMEIINELRMI